MPGFAGQEAPSNLRRFEGHGRLNLVTWLLALPTRRGCALSLYLSGIG